MKTFLFLLAFSIAINATSQTIKYVSKADEIDAANIKSINGQSIQLDFKMIPSFTRYKFSLSHLDNNLKPIDKEKIDIEDGLAIESGALLKFNDAIYFFYYGRDRKTDFFFAKLRKVNTTTLAVEEPVQIMEVNQKILNGRTVNFNNTYNKDSSQLIFTLDLDAPDKNNKKYSIQIVDNNLKSVFAKTVELPIKNELVLTQSVTYAENEKAFYIAYKAYEKPVDIYTETQYSKKTPDYTFNLLKITEKNDNPIIVKVDNNIVHKMNLQIEPNNKILISGLLKKTCTSNIHALFYGYLNTTANQMENIKIINYTDDIIKAIEADEFASTKNDNVGLFSFYNIAHTSKRENGSIDIVAEYYKAGNYSVATSKGFTNYSSYNCGDIVNTNIDANGKITFTRLPKNQYNVDHSGYLGSYFINYKNKLIILYNDTKGNLEKDINSKPSSVERFGFKNAALVQAIIDDNGKLTRQEITGVNENGFVIIPKRIKKINDNLFFARSSNLNFFTNKLKLGYLEMQ